MKFNLGKKVLTLVSITFLALCITACNNTTTSITQAPNEESKEEYLEPQIFIDKINGMTITVPNNLSVSDEGGDTGMMLRISDPSRVINGSLHVHSLSNATKKDADINRQTAMDILIAERESNNLVEHEAELVIIDGLEFNLLVVEHSNETRSKINSYFYHLNEEKNIFYNFIMSVEPNDSYAQEIFSEIIKSAVFNKSY